MISIRRIPLGLVALLVIASATPPPAHADDSSELAGRLAPLVTIHRDDWGVAHVRGTTDASVVFGFAYAQAEDFFWQVEDTYLQCVGRYAEAIGEAGLDSDQTNHLFEIATRSKADFENLELELQAICAAYAAGINHYLATHPDVTPRLLDHFEPWYVLAYERHMMLGRLYGRAHASRGRQRELLDELRAATGSNAWAVGPSKTKDGSTMLFINPHQPWFGSGQFWEGHVVSDEGWDFSGSTFFGGPFPTMGHNAHLGWAHTVNEPDVADLYRLTFDDPDDPLKYRTPDGHQRAVQWSDVIRVRTAEGVQDREFTYRKSHLGPIVAREDETHFIALRIAKLFEGSRMRQALGMTKATNLDEWRAAVGRLNLQMFNTVYADRHGNILYLYNGAVPRRDPGFDWTQPVDAADARTEWQGLHPLDELPQVLNPPSGFVQNCNSTPFTTTDGVNPYTKDFPPYMVEEKYDDKRRAKISRWLLRQAEDLTFDDWQRLAFDTTLDWPRNELPRAARAHRRLQDRDSDLASRVQPYLEHLLDWDYTNDRETTQTLLCMEWYIQLYGRGYPVETLKPEFVQNPDLKFEALVTAAENLQRLYGTWKVPWAQVSRIQRPVNVANPRAAPFTESEPSLPCTGVPGPLGVAFTVYYTAPTPKRKTQFAYVGGSFMGVYEFGDEVKAGTLLQFGTSGDPQSPHYFDQAKMYSEEKFKPAYYDWDEVIAHTVRSYHPGD